MRRAGKELQQANNKLKRIREERKSEEAAMMQGGAALLGAGAAALIDEKFGEGGAPAEKFGVPVNAGVAGAGLAAALLGGNSIPARREVAAFSLGMGCAALYQLVRDNVDFED